MRMRRCNIIARCLRYSLRSFSHQAPSKKTPLYQFHVNHGAKMVPFAGYLMPLQYADQSLIQSHLHTRSDVSLFDVSHMLQTKVFGKNRIEFMESLLPSDIKSLKLDHGTLSVFTNEQGGIKDDLIVNNTSVDHLCLVTNAGCIEKDIKYMQDHAQIFRNKKLDVTLEHVDQHTRCLIALQGPAVARIFQSDICSIDFSKLYFMMSSICTIFGIADCRMTRCGYTGEDGVEISVDSRQAVELCEKLLACTNANVKLAGLGARDTLRLEAGLCLYGNDISESTTPVEANLTWLISKRRRQLADFPGASIILEQLRNKNFKRKRVGLVSHKGRPPRGGGNLLDENGLKVGEITSGCPSPSQRCNIAMGYCSVEKAVVGTKLTATLSADQTVDVEVVKMPFVATHYYTEPKK